ncbi:MAG: TIGR03986 family CRISPR-associated RAMP protein [Muribaculaceae bacterium]|nr:TIGR03986 family CRISPR-associated RAMP protein [Muribaculaceae bacterium]
MIKAPFNFIPLSDQVVFPEWGDQISHDVPFSDGISGSISVRLTAESPIFVRNGHSQEDRNAKNGEFATFSRIGDKFFLPGTTVKGAIRNVLEILTFSKMDVDRNARFAQREWDNGKLYPLKKEVLKLRCGWLREKAEGGYEIIDCGRPYRIGQKELDSYFGSDIFEREFSQKSNKLLNRDLNKDRKIDGEDIDPKLAYYKYKLIEEIGAIDDLEDLRFSNIGSNALRVGVDPDGDIQGTIVLTGQPDLWMYPRPQKLEKNAGKFYEFVFRNPERLSEKYPLSEEEFEQYKFIYTDSLDWKFVNERLLERTGIPVFFRRDEKSGKIRDWGLALLYKLPYDQTPYQTLPEDHRKSTHDMAECIFGYSDKEGSLKGRVQFSPFMSGNAKLSDSPVRLVLSGPKASYYPIYVDQYKRGKDGVMNGPNQYRTYNKEDEGRPSGWKRYLLRSKTWEKTATENVDTILHPLLPGAVFDGKIRFHNLRPEELGALLSALTFHGNEAECRHQIGMAKPYGYGKVRLDISDLELISVGSVDDGDLLDSRGYMAVFEKFMDDSLRRSWSQSASVSELMTVTRFEVPNNDDFDYMTLDMDGHNEFNIAKGGKQQKEFPSLYLQRYSELIRRKFSPSSLEDESTDALQRLSEQRSAHQSERRKQEEEESVRVKAIEEERARKEQERLEAELHAEKERKEAELAARKAEKAAGGLSFLDEKYESGTNAGKYKIDEFKKLRPRLEDYLNKIIQSDHVPEEQLNQLEACLLRLAEKPSRDEKKKKLWSVRTSPLWSFIEKVTSKEWADRLFNLINK